jgi:hypothetical protein
MGQKRTACRILVRKPKGKNNEEELDIRVGGWIILKWILEK